jgi:hypothetical protein
MARIRSYMDQVQNLSRASAHYTDMLRGRWASFCPLRHARSSRMTEGAAAGPGSSHKPAPRPQALVETYHTLPASARPRE